MLNFIKIADTINKHSHKFSIYIRNKKQQNDKNIIITDIIKNLNNKEENEIEDFNKILNENLELYKTQNREELLENEITNLKEEKNNRYISYESKDRINISNNNKVKIKKRNYNE